MHAEHRSTLRTDPFLVLVFHKTRDADLLDADQIFDRAGTVLRAIAFVQLLESRTGKCVAPIAILNFSTDQFFTVLDLTGDTGCCFEWTNQPAARTGLFLPGIGAAQTAVDPARCDQRWGSLGFDHVSSPRFLHEANRFTTDKGHEL